jgi:Arabinose efflux permease
MSPSRSPFSALNAPNFRALWLWTPLSSLGSMVQYVGAAWLMASITDSADMVALVQTATTLPLFLFSIAAGTLSDSWDKRLVMLTAQAFMLAASLLLAALVFFGIASPWMLLGFTFIIASGTALNNPAWQASVGELVPREDLAAAISLNAIAFNITRSVGPAIGGAIVAAAGAATAFALNAASYLGLLLKLIAIGPFAPRKTLPREPFMAALSDGLRYVAMTPNMPRIILRAFVFALATISIQALMPLIARDLLGGGPIVYGVLLGAFGVGGVIGGFSAQWLRARFDGEWVMRLNHLGGALSLLCLPFCTALWMAIPPMLLGGASWLLTFSHCNVTIQMLTPRWVVARVLAAYQTGAFGGMAAGSWMWGVVAEEVGIVPSLLFSGLLALGGFALGLIPPLRMPDLSDQNLDPLGHVPEAHIDVDMQGRSGPVVVLIEYRIRPEDETAFRQAMSERRRIRRRNGARSWMLSRDLEHREVWFECFQTATWTEYLRHSERTTRSDALVAERILALHQGEGRPRVTRMLVRPTLAR